MLGLILNHIVKTFFDGLFKIQTNISIMPIDHSVFEGTDYFLSFLISLNVSIQFSSVQLLSRVQLFAIP